MNTINNTNDLSEKTNAIHGPIHQDGDDHIKASPGTVTVGGMTVRLYFNKEGDLTSRLANAFDSMLG